MATVAAATAPMLVITCYAVVESGLSIKGVPLFFFWWLLIWVIAALHMAAALPLYWLLHERNRVNWVSCALAGTIIGAIPIPLLFQLPMDGSLILAAFTGGAGLAGGLTFYWALGRGRRGIA